MAGRKSKDTELSVENISMMDEAALLKQILTIIENRKYRAATAANSEVTLMFWEVGQVISTVTLGNKRAAYGKKILTELASKLTEIYGNSFPERNLYRMIAFSECFDDIQILMPLAAN